MFFHYINFPNIQTLKKIVNVHYPDIKKNLLDNALKIFFEIREIKGLKKNFNLRSIRLDKIIVN